VASSDVSQARILPLRRWPTLLVAVAAVAAGVLAILGGFVVEEPEGRYNPGLVAFLGGPWGIGVGIWIAWTPLRARWFARLSERGVSLLGRDEVPFEALVRAEVDRRDLVLSSAEGAPVANAPLRLSRLRGSEVLAALRAHGVETRGG
jgi:hypothetical protein